MKTGIQIGAKQSKKKTEHIISILHAIGANDISDKVGVQALITYTDITKVSNVTIQNCTIRGIGEDAIEAIE